MSRYVIERDDYPKYVCVCVCVCVCLIETSRTWIREGLALPKSAYAGLRISSFPYFLGKERPSSLGASVQKLNIHYGINGVALEAR